MVYSRLSTVEFEKRYQALADYIKNNENKSSDEISKGLADLPRIHPLKGKSLTVVNRDNGKSFLHKAAAQGNIKLISFLKETDHEINLQDNQHKTPLYDACAELKLAAVNTLLAYDADPDLGNSHIPPVIIQTENKEEHKYYGEIVPLVATTESKATVTAAELAVALPGEDFSGLTSEQATERAATLIVTKLIEKGANLNLQTTKNNLAYIPIPATEFDTRYQALADYIKNNANKSLQDITEGLKNLPNGHVLKNKYLLVVNKANGKSFLHKAAAQGNLELIKFLQESGHTINLQDNQYKTSLYDACAELKLAAVNALLAYDAEPNRGNNHLYETAMRNGKLEKYYGAKVPLVAAIKSEVTLTAAELAAALPGEDFSGLTNEQATERVAVNIVKKLIEKGAKINRQFDENNFSVVHLAAIKRKLLIIDQLANAKADFNLVDRDGQTVLHMIADYRTREDKEYAQTEMEEEKQITELVVPLLEVLNIKEPLFGNTPLHAAVICSNMHVVKAIYQKDYLFFNDLKLLSIQNDEGNTAIHEAVLHAERGPKVLQLLLRVATKDDLAIVNNKGETAEELAKHLLGEAQSIAKATAEVRRTADELEDFFVGNDSDQVSLSEVEALVENLHAAVEQLKNEIALIDDAELSAELATSMDVLSQDIQDIKEHKNGVSFSSEDAEGLNKRAQELAMDTDYELLHEEYIDALESVQGEKYSTWKEKILELPTSFPDLDVIDTYSIAYQTELAQANRLLKIGENFLASNSLAVNDNLAARISIENAIKIFHKLKIYYRMEEEIFPGWTRSYSLEGAYQTLAITYINAGEAASMSYETSCQDKLRSVITEEKLQGHLALAGLYKGLKEWSSSLWPVSLPLPAYFSIDKADLAAHESYHYHEAYKLTQGKLDDAAHVVLQREIGVANNEKLGTYNIQQCVAVVAFDPIKKKVVLSHFDRFSGPLSFIEQLLAQFPEQTKLDLYISGGRDRSSLASPGTTSTTKISDNNIDQVLKQIHTLNVESSPDGNPENGRFSIKACDVGVGDKSRSPEAIVFDVHTQKLVHATPNLADSSLDSRAVSFLLQKIKRTSGDYLRPLNPIDFTKSVVDRTNVFSEAQQEQINALEASSKLSSASEAWKHNQGLYQLMTVNNEINRISKPDFSQGLLKKLVLSRFTGSALRGAGMHSEAVANDDDYVDLDTLDQLDINSLACFGNRRRRDANCVLDSEKLLEELKDLDETKQSQILQQVATRQVAGTKQKEIFKLVLNEKTLHHLQKVGKFSSILMRGMIAKDTLAALLKGDGNTVAINLGFMGASHGLGELANLVAIKGVSLVKAGETLLGKSLLVSTPFLKRGTSLFIAFDLVNQVKALESGDKDAIAGVVGDSIILGVDLLSIGVEVAEISELVAGISSVTGPVGEAIGAIVMLGVQIYKAVQAVERMDHLVNLTDWEEFKEGWRAFLGMQSEEYIKKMIDEVTEYQRILPKKLEFLTANPSIKHLIFAAIEQIGETCRVVQERSTCGGGLSFPPTPCNIDKTVCDPVFAAVKDNAVYLKKKGIGIRLTREKITAPSGTQLLCVPMAKNGELLFETEAYPCQDAIGLTNTNNTTAGTVAFYDLGEGTDRVAGFDDIPNIFMLNNGAKKYQGGHRDDVFMVQATEIETIDSEPDIRGLDGKEGSDSLLLQGFQPLADKVVVDFIQGYIQYGKKTLEITSIEKLIGGAVPLSVTVACATQEIDTQGAPTFSHPDTILIPQNASCDYAVKMHLQPNTVVQNQARQGNFTYYILPGIGRVAVNLVSSGANATAEHLTHQVVFNAEISDLASISLPSSTAVAEVNLPRTISFHFLDHKIRKLSRTIQTIFIEKNTASSDINLNYQLKPGLVLSEQRLFWLPRTLNQTYAQQVLKNHVDHDADSFNVTLSKRHVIRHVLLNLLKNSGVVAEDFKLNVTYSLANEPFFHFVDGVELKIGAKNNYLFHHTELSVDDIMHHYAPIARRLNMICIISTSQNQRVVIGHRGHEVMHNDPHAYKTHLNGNGGEALFVITANTTLSQLPLSETILYHFDTGHINTLDFRPLMTQIQTEFNATAQLRFITPNRENKLDKDLLLTLSSRSNHLADRGKGIDFITVRLKDALLDHWYKAYLHVILQVAPQQIVGSLRNLHLKPLPLILDDTHELVVIGVADVEENTEIIIPRASNQGDFFHDNKTNLIWTNTLSDTSEIDKPFSIILKDFWPKFPMRGFDATLATLTFKFSNKKVVLSRKLAEINIAENYADASNERKAALKEESLAIISSQQLDSNQASHNASEINLRQEYYSNNAINVTSTEVQLDDSSGEAAHAINLLRRRRSMLPAASKLISSGSTQHSGVIQQVFSFIQQFYSDKSVKHIKQVVQDFNTAINYRSDSMKKIAKANPICKSFSRKNAYTIGFFPASATALSTKVITPSAWWKKLPLNGVAMGVSNAVFDKVSQSRRGHVLQLITLRTCLDMLLTTSHYALNNLANQDNEDSISPWMDTSFFAMVGLTASMRSIWIGLEHSDRPFIQLAKECLQAFCYTYYLYWMFDFFLRDGSNEEKLEEMLNWIKPMAAMIIADKATRTLLNSETVHSFFRTTRAVDQEEVPVPAIQHRQYAPA